jgi:RecA/RadA recombinase
MTYTQAISHTSLNNIPKNLIDDHKQKLMSNGYVSVEQVLLCPPECISRDTEIPHDEVISLQLKLQECYASLAQREPMTLRNTLNEQLEGFLLTGCPQLDSLLGSGVPLERITEFVSSGNGLSRNVVNLICLHVCVNLCLDVDYGGCQAKAVIIDTEFKPLAGMVSRICRDRIIKNSEGSEDPRAVQEVIDDTLSRIKLLRAFTIEAFDQALEKVEELLNEDTEGQIKLLLINSLSVLRLKTSLNTPRKMSSRSSYLASLGQKLRALACRNNIAVITTNYQTSTNSKYNFGDVWSYCLCNRVMFTTQSDHSVYSKLIKSSYQPEGELELHVPFIEESGEK